MKPYLLFQTAKHEKSLSSENFSPFFAQIGYKNMMNYVLRDLDQVRQFGQFGTFEQSYLIVDVWQQ